MGCMCVRYSNGSYVLGNGPHVFGNGPLVLGNVPHVCTLLENLTDDAIA